MKNRFVFLVFGILVLGFMSGFVGAGKDVSVIISGGVAEKRAGFGVSEEKSFKVIRKFSSFDAVEVIIDEDDLDLFRDRYGDRVYVANRTFRATLDVSVAQIGGNDTWYLTSNGFNITGTGQTACVIDTGVNYSHPDLGGCYGENNASSNCTVIGGYDWIGDDEDPMDEHVLGHGTHIAGIIASNHSVYRGVAPGTKILAMRVLDSSGNSENESDVLAAIDWCVSNASKFNVSVITMSLGDGSTNNNYCTSASWDNQINAAVNAGIPVVISAGNCDQVGQENCTIGVSFPACIENATRVGTVNDEDSISGFGTSGYGFMRGALFELLAPGVNIISLSHLGGTSSKTGTSMAAPHVSGSILLIKQYLELSSQLKTVDEIEEALNDSGVRIDDSAGSGYNFTRINVKDVLLSLDVDSPEVSLDSPSDGFVSLDSNQSFVCNFSDWQLDNVTFMVWNSSGVYYNSSLDVSGSSNSSEFNLTGIPNGDYSWNCFVRDSIGNLGSASSNFTFTIGEIVVSLSEPLNGSFVNSNETDFICNVSTDSSFELVNLTFMIWNSSVDLLNSSTVNVSGVSNSSVFNYDLSEDGVYDWGCFGYNNNSDMRVSSNYSLTYDSTFPAISNLSYGDPSSVSATISWDTDEEANSSLIVSGGSWTNSSGYTTSHLISVSGLSAGTSYTFIASSCDRAGNCVNDSGNFVTDSTSVGGGGGGGGSNNLVINVDSGELFDGVSHLLDEGDRMVFVLTSGSHALEVEEIGEDFVEVVISSEPLKVNLSLGEEYKFNLSSEDFYDLKVWLNGFENGDVNISVMRIFEVVPKDVDAVEKDNFTNESVPDRVFHVTDEEGAKFDWTWVIVGIVGLVGLVWFLSRRWDIPKWIWSKGAGIFGFFIVASGDRRNARKEIKRKLKHAKRAHRFLKERTREEKKLKRKESRKNRWRK